MGCTDRPEVREAGFRNVLRTAVAYGIAGCPGTKARVRSRQRALDFTASKPRILNSGLGRKN